MVGEFPDLQGIMGSYYARADGEAAGGRRGDPRALPAARARAMRCRRRAPASRSRSPTSSTRSPASSRSASSPTGNKDPFGLRRAALGVQRILIEKGLELDLKRLIDLAVAGVRADIDRLRQDASASTAPKAHVGADVVSGWIYDFLMERLRVYYLERTTAAPGRVAVTTEMFDAVLAARPVSPLDFDARLKALSAFLDLPESASLTAANKRIANILRKAPPGAATGVNVEYLREEAEVRLYDAMRALQEAVASATAERQYTAALGRLCAAAAGGRCVLRCGDGHG